MDTRAGDSGAALVIMEGQEKVLIGMQVAIMLSNSQEKKQHFSIFNQPDNYFQAGGAKFRHFNLAINPHLGVFDTYRHVFYAEVSDTKLD